MKLNIYDKREIVNTYTAETYDIMFGTVEDLINILNLDGLKSNDDVELIKIATQAVINGFDIIKPLLKDVFDGLTDEELRNTKVSEIVSVLIEIVKFSISQIGKSANGKN